MNPTTFDEKLLWLNLYWRHPLKTECGDKYTLRKYVERLGLGHLLPRVHGTYESVEAIDFGALPERFVLKCTHGCKSNVYCHSKAALDVAATRQDLAKWMGENYSRRFGELHYADMTPRIICEEFLDDGTGVLPTDYKMYCFNGRPRWVLCCTNRVPNGKAQLSFVDIAWNLVSFYRDQPTGTKQIPKPGCLHAMLHACERLSAPFPFVRVDFYCIDDRPVLGEMTFTPDACVDPSYTDVAQHEMGRALDLGRPAAGTERKRFATTES